MADEIEMVVVDGVRYRPEHAPKSEEKSSTAQHKARKPAAKAESGAEADGK
ncbi:MAG: hypothetical protein JWO69_1995 [Thermoleophilia bacterium]|nr:hypothetical protein [Thermoleophilia bacterium]